MTGSNRRPSACKADALPAELILHLMESYFRYREKNPGDPYGIRTRVTAVKGRCLNRLTKGPLLKIRKIKTPKGLAWQRPTLTGTFVPTTIGAEKLNFRVRYGNGCDLLAIITRLFC